MSASVASVGGGTPQAWSGASPYAAPAAKMSNLYSQIDASGAGSINAEQFAQAFTTKNPPGVFKREGASAIFEQLDTKGTGSVSKSDFVSGMTSLMRSLRDGGSSSNAPAPSATISSSLNSLNQLDVFA